MKKILLLFMSTMGTGILCNSQDLITEDFNSMTTGNFATAPISYATSTSSQNGWSIISYLATPNDSYFQIENSGTNRFAITGSPTATGSPQTGNNYAQKMINWVSRTVGNDVAYAECTFNTGTSSTSKNEFYFAIYNASRSKCLGGFVYVRDTKVLKSLAYDSTDASNYGNYLYSSISTGNTSLILQDETDYYLRVAYDINTSKTYWYVSLQSTQGVALCNASHQNSSILTDASLLVTAAKSGTANASASTAYFDNILIQARPCYKYTTQAVSDFSYVSGMHCIGSSNLTANQVVSSSTGIFTSTPSGLLINQGTGVIDMANSAPGDYIIEFVTNNSNTCSDSTSASISLTSSVTPTFNIPDLICTGSTAPVLSTTSNNTITGTWSPATVSNATSGTYVFTPNSGQCVYSVTKAINVVSSPVTPLFSISTVICDGESSPILPTTSNNSVTGSWLPATVSNSVSGTYTFSPNSGNCATSTDLSIVIAAIETPEFTIASSICAESTAPILLTTSDNGVSGTWLPANVSNIATATYTFTPSSDECASSVSTTITVTSNVTPVFSVTESICQDAIPPVLTETSDNSISGTWLPENVSNTSTGTYIFTPTIGICANSASITVTVEDCANVEEKEAVSYSISPNPASESFTVTFPSIIENGTIYFFTSDGKLVEKRNYNHSSMEKFDIQTLQSGVYFFQIDEHIEKVIIN